MIAKMISRTKKIKKRSVNLETISYWEATTDEEQIIQTREYWNKIKSFRNKTLAAMDIAKMYDKEELNTLFAEKIMNWVWNEEPVVFVEDVIPGGFLMHEKVKVNITHFTYKNMPLLLQDFTNEEFAIKLMERLKINNVQYGLQPIEDGYEVYCEKHRLSIFAKTFGEVICKLALITLADVRHF